MADMCAVVAKGDDLNIWDDTWMRGTVLSRSALEIRWESQDLPRSRSEISFLMVAGT